MPDKDRSRCSDRDYVFLVRRNVDLGDRPGVPDALVVAESLIIPPDFDLLVLPTRGKVLSLARDGKSVDLAQIAALEHPDSLSVEGGPVGHLRRVKCKWVLLYLSVGARCQKLALLGMIKHGSEQCLVEETDNPREGLKVPNNAGSVRGYRYRLLVVLPDLGGVTGVVGASLTLRSLTLPRCSLREASIV